MQKDWELQPLLCLILDIGLAHSNRTPEQVRLLIWLRLACL